MNTNKSQELYKLAQEYFPGGVNSPVRSFKSVNSNPLFIESGEGAYVYDCDNNQYIDYVNSWGANIIGHAHPEVINSIQTQIKSGLGFGACHNIETQLAQLVQKFVPQLECMRFVNSGTEACMSAIRLARAYTQKNIIIKFNGNYHGHADSFLVQAGSGVATLGIPSTSGIPEEITQNTISLPYNNLALVQEVFEKYKSNIACVILEPVIGNAGCIIPETSFIQGLRDICTANNSLLIFDEVMTGFRVRRGGCSELYNIQADLYTFGKVIGGGLPVGLYGGRQDIMALISPLGSVYQAGTLSGNPVSLSAGLATLELINSQPDFYAELENKTKYLKQQIESLGTKHNIPLLVNQCGGMFGIFFTDKSSINNFEEAQQTNTQLFIKLFNLLLDEGVYLPPSPYEACFITIEHTQEVLDDTIYAIDKCLKKI